VDVYYIYVSIYILSQRKAHDFGSLSPLSLSTIHTHTHTHTHSAKRVQAARPSILLRMSASEGEAGTFCLLTLLITFIIFIIINSIVYLFFFYFVQGEGSGTNSLESIL
jgi:hypothetical protein